VLVLADRDYPGIQIDGGTPERNYLAGAHARASCSPAPRRPEAKEQVTVI
jgi:hypothetical protein